MRILATVLFLIVSLFLIAQPKDQLPSPHSCSITPDKTKFEGEGKIRSSRGTTQTPGGTALPMPNPRWTGTNVFLYPFQVDMVTGEVY